MNNIRYRPYTKIICTLGPATDKGEVLRDLLLNGMNVARLNFSHGSHEDHLSRVQRFKALRDETGIPAALLCDMQGPEIRIRTFAAGRVTLAAGSSFRFTTQDIPGTEEAVSVSCPDFPHFVKPGDIILLDDGLIAMRVERVSGGEVTCRVTEGGVLSNKKKINIPGKPIPLPFLNDKDRSDLRFAVAHEFDYIAASFVRNAADVIDLRTELLGLGGDWIKIISKIECRQGVDNIDDILRVSDGIMVARGDMGVEIPYEELPAIQKRIIRKCYEAGKPVVTATQMLESMVKNPRPTRAEITDVANAIYDGTTAIMLSAETSVGEYPVESLKAMARIAAEAERDIDYVKRFAERRVALSRNVTSAIGRAACELAHALGAAAIVTVTKSGHTAHMVSRYRPACPVIAVTTSPRVINQLALAWGVVPLRGEVARTTDEVFAQAAALAERTGVTASGDLMVITGGAIADLSGATSILRVHVVGEVLVEGKGSNPGIASGAVCVIGEPPDVEEFNAGNIMMIRHTTEEILQLLRHAAAIITEEDDENSRAVAAARECGIPAISNARNAAAILKSGMVVTVDGTTGRVTNGMKRE